MASRGAAGLTGVVLTKLDGKRRAAWPWRWPRASADPLCWQGRQKAIGDLRRSQARISLKRAGD